MGPGSRTDRRNHLIDGHLAADCFFEITVNSETYGSLTLHRRSSTKCPGAITATINERLRRVNKTRERIIYYIFTEKIQARIFTNFENMRQK